MGRGQNPAAAILVSKPILEILEQIIKGHNTAQQIVKRAKVIILAQQGYSNSHIARELALSLNTVKKWRKRWQQADEGLQEYEQHLLNGQMTKQELLKYVKGLLSDLPRSGKPQTFSEAQKQQIIAIACDKPIHHGIPITNWTYEMLAKVAIAKGIVESISPRHLGRILKNKPFTTTQIRLLAIS